MIMVRPDRKASLVGDAAPQDAAVPDRRAFAADRAFREPPNGCRRLRSAARLRGCLADLPVALSMNSARTPFVRLGPAGEMMAGENVLSCPAVRSRHRAGSAAACRDGSRIAAICNRPRCRAARSRSACRAWRNTRAPWCARPCASSWSCRPSSISSRTACGSTLMPTPSGLSSGTLSNTLAGTPIWCRLSASVSPPMPPPAMRTVMIRPCYCLGVMT